jgi:flagellar M-ring protein FliF
LIDYRGRLLTRNESVDNSGLSTRQLDMRQKIETDLSTKVLQILEPAVGTGKVRPQVSVVMNFQQVEETVEQYDPQGSVIRSRATQEERQTKSTERNAGIPGPRATPSSNPANPAPARTDPTSPEELSKQSETINYEVSKAVRHVVNPMGAVERLSVAVIIDNHTTVTTGSDGTQQTTQEPRNADEMKKYKDLVSAAIGINPQRGDQLIVENVSFEGEPDLLLEPPTFLEKQGPVIMVGLRYLIIPVAFVILYLLFLRPLQVVIANWMPGELRGMPRPPVSIQTPMTVKQLEAQLRGAPPVQDIMSPQASSQVNAPEPSRIDVIRKRVVEHAHSDPEAVAKLVKMWLHDERNK